MHRKWLVKRTNPEYISYISKTASISPALAKILVNRGIKTVEKIKSFIAPSFSALSNPFDFAGLETAVQRIKSAISSKEKILIHGDYDADGLTATAIMVHVINALGGDVHYFIPNRIQHGYGFNLASIDLAKKMGITLIITVDCGITAFDTASYAKKQRIEVIITDHHEPSDKNILPEAAAVINPKYSAPGSDSANLSGAGIAFKVAQALDSVFQTEFSSKLLDLAAIGTMADVVPIIGENRIIVKEGLKLIDQGHRTGISALKSIAGIDKREISAGLLAFTLIPRINAAGRIGDAADVVRLLTSDIADEVSGLSSWLDKLNSERQKLDADVYQQALSIVNEKKIGNVIVLSGEGWHQGVLGIVASRLADEFSRPVFVFAVKDGIAKGSARSIPCFDICSGLAECKDLLLSFGGHKQAAGIKLSAENLEAFEKAMHDLVNKSVSESDLEPLLEIDADVMLSEVNHNLLKELDILQPFGYGNPEPVLGAKKLEVVNPRIVGSNHLKMKLKQGSQSIDAVGFDMGKLNGLLSNEDSLPQYVDAVFTPALNEWNGGRYVQLILKAFRPSQ
ncbi:MAG: single-stranded-DNA-specific exonuclease RecJ [Nitrospiraceae bacterium]|nr:single-stranded-DNA-specific exonuclease RecJ [Nitrospiraceae bacterium]